jgi:hypothetical protein
MLGREIRLPYEVTREGHDHHRSDKTVTLGAHALKIKKDFTEPIMWLENT